MDHQLKVFRDALRWAGIITLLLAALAVILWVAKHEMLAIALLTSFVAMLLMGTHLLAFTVGCFYSKAMLLAGADVGLRAKESADEVQIGVMTAVGRLLEIAFKEMKADTPALPLPQQRSGWLPADLQVPTLTGIKELKDLD